MIADGPAGRRQTVEPLTSYSVDARAPRVPNQSSLGFIATATNRNLDEPRGSCRPGLHRRRRLDWRLKKRYAVQGFFVGQQRPRRRRGDRRAAGEQRPQLSAPGFATRSSSTRRGPSLNGYRGDGRRSTRSRGERVRFSSNVSMKSPGFDINDVGFMQRADTRNMSNWMQWRNERPVEVPAQLPLQPQSVGGLELRRRPAELRRQRQRARGVPEQLVDRHGTEPLRAAVRRPRDARRPRRVPQRPAQHVGVLSTATSASRSASTSSAIAGKDARGLDHTGTSAPTLGWRPSSFISASAGV